ncbi:MAG: hypothetical protein R3300_02370 [Candidatus Promineifilaceae bacterium]|nr:hypothetical protein [Candidatus Promineifilaceae bacterium]
MLPTRIATAPTIIPAVQPSQSAEIALPLPVTWTAEPIANVPSPTSAGLPSRTPVPTHTPWPTFTATPTSTSTPSPTPTASPSPTETATVVPVVADQSLLPNGSFEEGWYHINDIPELQVPNRWTLEWETGENPLDPDPWNHYVRPESRVLNEDFLPAAEHGLFVWDGDYTYKVFKKEGALSFRVYSHVYLPPGDYVLEINAFPDMIAGYTDGGSKIWAPDPLSGELRFIVDGPVSPWYLPEFGRRNTYRWAFTVTEARTVRIGAAFRGRWAIQNNGWFFDDWSLTQVLYP